MLKLKSLVMFILLVLAPLHHTANAASNPAMVPIISYLLSDSSFSFSSFVGKTKYFINQNGIMGYRDYLDNDTYTGVVNGEDVVGTYTYDDDSMTLTRDDGTLLVFTNPRPTIFGDGTTFDLSVNGSPILETHNYDTEDDRDAYIQAMSYSYEELASNTFYGVNEQGLFKFVITYAALGTNERNLTVGSFDQTNDTQQTFTISDNVITLGMGATITRVGVYADYSRIFYDHDGEGIDYAPVPKRIYADRAKAEAFYEELYAQVIAYSYEELASNTFYGVNEDGLGKFVITYATLGTNERNLTVGSFDQTNDIQQTFTISDNVITLGTGATITRVAVYTDYSHIFYDNDGEGTDYAPVPKRIYADRAKAEAFFEEQYIQAMSYSYEELASNTFYGVNEDGSSKFVITYAELGTNERNLTVGSFDQTNDIQQTFTISDNIITLGTGATITRIAIYTDYSQILFDQDGEGDSEAVLKRIYADRAKAEAFYDSF